MTKLEYIRNYGNYNCAYLFTVFVYVIICGTTFTSGALSTCHFENAYGCRDRIPAKASSEAGWRVYSSKPQNSFAYASCADECVEKAVLFKGLQSMSPAKWKVEFCYYLSTLEGAVVSSADMRVIACGRNLSVPMIEGVWKSTSVQFGCSEPFKVGFEIHLSGVYQRVALDEVIVTDPNSNTPPRQCSDVAPSLFDLPPTIDISPQTAGGGVVGHETAVLGDKINPDDEALVANTSNALPNKPSASEKTIPPDDNSANSLFDEVMIFFENLLQNPLLLAEVLAIATVTVCCVTISIHCYIWRKQRRSYRLHKTRSIRAQRYLAREMSNSDMLLDMTVHDSDGNFTPMSRSRSSSRDVPLADKKKLKATKHAADRRATVSNGSGSGSASCEDIGPLPHPRTKSLPNRPPTNVYETIDEVRKNALQPVQEGDGSEDNKNLSHSFPTLVDTKAPEPPKSRRHAKSCREKRDRKSKKQSKKQHKKQSNKTDTNENRLDDKELPKIKTPDASRVNEGLTVDAGHLYDRLGRTNSNPDFEKVGFVDHSPSEIRKHDRLSLSVNVNRDPMQKHVGFRPRALSQQNQGSAEWNPPSPRLAKQNLQINTSESKELNTVAESNYFTLEPIAIAHPNGNRSSSELSDIVMSGSVDTLQEELIIAQNHTDSFKRSIGGSDPKSCREDLSLVSNATECPRNDTNTTPTIIVQSADNVTSRDSNQNEFASRTYETLEPPNMNRDVHRTQSSEETYF